MHSFKYFGNCCPAHGCASASRLSDCDSKGHIQETVILEDCSIVANQYAAHTTSHLSANRDDSPRSHFNGHRGDSTAWHSSFHLSAHRDERTGSKPACRICLQEWPVSARFSWYGTWAVFLKEPDSFCLMRMEVLGSCYCIPVLVYTTHSHDKIIFMTVLVWHSWILLLHITAGISSRVEWEQEQVIAHRHVLDEQRVRSGSRATNSHAN